jgi:hypothetical protein
MKPKDDLCIVIYNYPHSILLKSVLSDLYLLLYDSYELNELDENPTSYGDYCYLINKMEFSFTYIY